jgi:hypothetical protein
MDVAAGQPGGGWGDGQPSGTQEGGGWGRVADGPLELTPEQEYEAVCEAGAPCSLGHRKETDPYYCMSDNAMLWHRCRLPSWKSGNPSMGSGRGATIILPPVALPRRVTRRGAWARVTIGRFRHLSPSTLKNDTRMLRMGIFTMENVT